MEYSKIDRQGRIVIPSKIRRILGISGEAEVIVRVESGRLVIEPIPRSLEEAVERWRETVLRVKARPFSSEAGGSWKWMSDEYAGKKLGVLP